MTTPEESQPRSIPPIKWASLVCVCAVLGFLVYFGWAVVELIINPVDIGGLDSTDEAVYVPALFVSLFYLGSVLTMYLSQLPLILWFGKIEAGLNWLQASDQPQFKWFRLWLSFWSAIVFVLVLMMLASDGDPTTLQWSFGLLYLLFGGLALSLWVFILIGLLKITSRLKSLPGFKTTDSEAVDLTVWAVLTAIFYGVGFPGYICVRRASLAFNRALDDLEQRKTSPPPTK